MNKFLQIQQLVAEKLQMSPGFPAKLKILAREEKDIQNDIDASLSKLGICIWVMPLLPKKAMVTECEIIFLESVEIKVRLIETPVISKKINFTVYDAMAVTMEALQGFNPETPGNPGDKLFAAPLGLATSPVNIEEDPDTRILDVIFDVAIQLQP